MGRSATPGDRILRQVQAIDAWNASMRMWEALLSASTSREGRLAGARRIDVLRRTHAAVAESTARELARPCDPMLHCAKTAVIAHQNPWFRERACALLTEHGFDVVERTDNGADALGAIIAEQPDLVLVGERLTMMSASDLLSETTLFSPLSVRLTQRLQAHSGSAARDDFMQAAARTTRPTLRAPGAFHGRTVPTPIPNGPVLMSGS